MTDANTPPADFETRDRGCLRSAQFGWNEYEGVKTPQLVCRFEILDGDSKGRTDTWFASLSEDASRSGKAFYEFTIDSLRACGWTGNDLAEVPVLAAAGQLAGEVVLVRTHRHKDGKVNTLVKYVNRIGGGGVNLKDKAMADDEVAAFAKRMKAKVAAAGGARPAVRDDRDPRDGLPWE